jgi:hypothetical protein
LRVRTLRDASGGTPAQGFLRWRSAAAQVM